MARYVMANRRAGKFLEAQKTASRAALAAGFDNLFASSVDVVHDLSPTDELARRVVVFDAEPEEVAAKALSLSTDVMLEPEILHFPVGGRRGRVRPTVADRAASPPAMTAPAVTGPTALAAAAAPLAGPVFAINVTGSGGPLQGAEVLVFIVGLRDPLSTTTDSAGVARLTLPPGAQVIGVIASPAGGHWSMVRRGAQSGDTVDCVPIASVGPIDWWHKQHGVSVLDVTRGSGIKVGVIDSGVGPHGCLAHATAVGSFINSSHDPAGGADVDSHGTHVSGLIAARPVGAGDRAGIAPGVTLFVARVFPAPHAGASQADIANAIDHLSRTRRVDLINMSLGAPQPSDIAHDAILDAAERGTLCMCAAGNSGGRVEFPAAFAESIAVSALGLKGTSPAGTVSATNTPTDPARHGAAGVFLASFSCSGTDVDTIAPGVATISTVPERFGLTRPYAVMDGTSMASPLACGVLAALLAKSAQYQALQGSARTDEARAILAAHCSSVGLAAIFQGRGIQRIP
jgi:subtilisin family serine protease